MMKMPCFYLKQVWNNATIPGKTSRGISLLFILYM